MFEYRAREPTATIRAAEWPLTVVAAEATVCAVQNTVLTARRHSEAPFTRSPRYASRVRTWNEEGR
jgi:hypothetical protein